MTAFCFYNLVFKIAFVPALFDELTMALTVIILAAGQGTRMKSSLPKVLHPLAQKPMLHHVVDAAHALAADTVHIVYGHGGDMVPQRMAHVTANFVEQAEQLGTGHAVAQAMPAVNAADTVLILYGDVPLIKPATLRALVKQVGTSSMGLLTVNLADPGGYGRIVRDADGHVTSIVEHKDATEQQRQINEINTGLLAVNGGKLAGWLSRLENNNAQGEYYLTDIIAMAVNDGVEVRTVQPDNEAEVMGVNNRSQLAELERHYQRERAEELMALGVTLVDPARFDVRGELEVGQDVSIDINVVFEGNVTIGDHVTIGPNNVIRNTRIGDGVSINANCVIEDAVIGNDSRIGPFARIRPETVLAEQTHIGNFVEIKKSEVGTGSKINHLSYVGDTTVGKGVNIGAGTITCNYDGANKHRTVIGDNAFIGSDTQLVAPVTIGEGATIGAGSTITRDAPPHELTYSRVTQETRKGWKRPTKKK